MTRVIRDIVYGEAGVAHGTAPRQVELRMDAYLPDAPAGPVPAVVLAFGGSFLRGSKEDDAFPTAGRFGANTAIAEYCRRFAAEGFACFSVGYRLAGDDPDPGTTPLLTRPDDVPVGRIHEVRKILGLPPHQAQDWSCPHSADTLTGCWERFSSSRLHTSFRTRRARDIRWPSGAGSGCRSPR